MGWSSLGTNEVITKAEIEVLQCSIKLSSINAIATLPKSIEGMSFINIIGHTDTKGMVWGTFTLNSIISTNIMSGTGILSFGKTIENIWLLINSDSVTVVSTNYDIATYPLNIDFIICYYW